MQPSVTITKLYSLLSEKLGKETAENLTNYIENKVQSEVENASKILATKKQLAETKADIIKWMFLFWVGQIAAMVAIIFLKK